MTEKSISVQTFITPEGSSTCAANFSTGETCEFLMSSRFETQHHCFYDATSTLMEYDGFIVPCEKCRVRGG